MQSTKSLKLIWRRSIHLMLALTLIVSGFSSVVAPVTAARDSMVIASWMTDTVVMTDPSATVTAKEGVNRLASTISLVGAGLKFDAANATMVDWRDGFTIAEGKPVPNKYWIARISTENFENMNLEFIQYAGNSGPRDFVVEYSLDNVSWTVLQAVVLTPNSNLKYNMNLPKEMNDEEQVLIRWGVISGDAANPTRELGEWGGNILKDVKIQGEAIEGRTIELDDEAPTAPKNLSGEGLTDTTIRLTWDASTDNEGVTGYYVYRDDSKVGTAVATSYTDSNLQISTTYDYHIKAFDAAGNESEGSNVVSVSTRSIEKVDLASWTITNAGTEGIIPATTGTYKDAAIFQNVGGLFEFVDTSQQWISYQGWDNGMDNKYWLATVPTKGFTNITVTSDQNSSGSGPRNFKLQMSTDNATWTDIAGTDLTMTVSNFNCASDACKLNNVPLHNAAEDQELIYLRWIVSSTFNTNGIEGGIGGSGSSRIRNIKVSGELIPDAVIEVPTLDLIKSPQNGSLDVIRDREVSVIFNKSIQLNDTHVVTIEDGDGTALSNVTTQVIDGNTLLIGHQGLAYSNTYTVTVPKEMVSGTDDSTLVRDVIWTFKTANSPNLPQSYNMTFNGDPRTSMAFAWYTETMTDTVVEVVEESLAPGNTFPDNLATAYHGISEKVETFMVAADRATNTKTTFVSHKVIADKLKPGTKYKFRLGNGEAGAWTQVGSFTTDTAENSDYRFIVGADSQSSSLSGFEPWGDTFKKAVGFIEDPKFLIVAGDLVDNGDLETQWQWMFSVAQDSMLQVPYVPVLGGHEVNDWDGDVTTNSDNFYYHFNVPKQVVKDTHAGSVYSFEYGDALYMVFNSQYQGGLADNSNDIAWEDPQFRAQVDWMNNTVARTDKKWKFVTFHKSPYAAGDNSALYEDERVQFYRQHLIPAFDEMGIDMVFEAHDHMYMRSFQMYGNEVVPEDQILYDADGNAINPKGTVYLMPNAMGNKFYQKAEYLHEMLPENDWVPSIKLDEKGDPIPYDDFFAAINAQPNKKMFTDVTVTDQVLSFKSYTAAIEDEGKPDTIGNGLYEYDRYGIKRTDVKPNKVENLEFEGKDNRITLTWDAPSDGEPVRGFRIYEENDKVATHWSAYIPAVQDQTSYSYTIEGINLAKKYELVVRAVGVRLNSDSVMIATKDGANEEEPPSAPTNLTATVVSPFQIVINWNKSPGNIEVSEYELYRNDVKITSTTSNVTTFTDIGLNPGAIYNYHVIALNTIDNESLPSNKVSVTTNESVSYNEGKPHKPFPQHVGYVEGSIKPNHITQEELDAEVIRIYKEWKEKYLQTNPYDNNQKYVWYTDNRDYNNPEDWETGSDDVSYFPITVSEAHGYGMITTAIMASHDPETKKDFDDLYRYFRAHPSISNPNLMAWRQGDTGSAIIDVNAASSATDGDMDIAYSLLLADQQWGSNGDINYLSEAKLVINAIMESQVYKTDWTLRLGDWATSGKYAGATRPSDFMLQHMKDYQVVTGDRGWGNTINSTYHVINHISSNYSPNAGLLPDFVVKDGNNFVPAPSGFLEGPDGDYYYNSARVPWRLTTDYLVTGDTSAKDILMTNTAWIRQMANNDPNNIFSGYKLDGSSGLRPSPEEEWQDTTFIAPFMVSAMIDKSHQNWLNDLWDYNVAVNTEKDLYFGNSIRMLSLIVVSGNWWSPTLVDVEAPTLATIDYANPVSSTEVELRWLAAEDNFAVAGYDVYRDGEKIATTSELTFIDEGLKPRQQYSYFVVAFDFAGNKSKASNMRLVTTLANSASNPNPGNSELEQPGDTNTNPGTDTEQPGGTEPNSPSKVELTDISNHWAVGAINRAVRLGIVQGYPDGKFNPDRPISREQFAVILARALNLQSGDTFSFRDHDKFGDWSKSGIGAAVSAGIILGYSDGSFRPNQAVTRAEMAMMLARAVEININTNTTTKFADDQAIPAWAKGAVALIHELGLIDGIGRNSFAPQREMTRAEAVVVALRLTNYLASLEKGVQP